MYSEDVSDDDSFSEGYAQGDPIAIIFKITPSYQQAGKGGANMIVLRTKTKAIHIQALPTENSFNQTRRN